MEENAIDFTRKYNATSDGNVFINSSAFNLPNDFYLEFYSDAAGTTPLDVTGLGLVVKMNEKKSDYVENIVTNEETLLECSGTETIFKNILTNSYIINCENEVITNYKMEVSILNGNYTII